MPFIPHTEKDITAMLQAIGVDSIETLFDEIPAELRITNTLNLPAGVTEMQLMQEMMRRSSNDQYALNFIGAGAYEHHIPAAVWDITTRGEFMTAYTPYQAEASQGTLQLIYEYQTMMTRLLAMEVSNASLYDGAMALAEAGLMAVRIQQKRLKTPRLLMPLTISPRYRAVVHTMVIPQGIELVDVPYDPRSGVIDRSALTDELAQQAAALVIPQPNFFGQLEEVDELVDWAKSKGLLSIALVNPTAMALLKPPGEWGQAGADIVCGEGQPLGVPLASGGPYFGFMACRETHVRQLPGRIVGRTVDVDGKEGFTLTLQAREQHIRRAKATSNVCTNQGLLVTAATIYLSLLGKEGLYRVATQCHANTRRLLDRLSHIAGISVAFTGPYFHEGVIRLPQKTSLVIERLAKIGIEAGYDLSSEYPELGNTLLVCATETKTDEDIERFAVCLAEQINS